MNKELKAVLLKLGEWELRNLLETMQMSFGMRERMTRYGLTSKTMVEELNKFGVDDVTEEDIKNILNCTYELNLKIISKIEFLFATKQTELIRVHNAKNN